MTDNAQTEDTLTAQPSNLTPRLQWGKHRGKSPEDIHREDPQYLHWLISDAEAASDRLIAECRRVLDNVGAERHGRPVINRWYEDPFLAAISKETRDALIRDRARDQQEYA